MQRPRDRCRRAEQGRHFAMGRAGGRIFSVTSQRNEANGEGASPFVELDRHTWSRLAAQMEQPLNEEDVLRLRGLGDPLDIKEVSDVYLPLSRLLHLYVEAAGQLHAATTTFLGEQTQRTP